MDTSNMNIDELYQYDLSIIDGFTRVTDVLALLEIANEDIEEFQGTMECMDTGLCVMCPQEVVLRDVLNIPWCAEHQFRGVFINLMADHRWPTFDVYDADFGRAGAWIESDGRFTRKEIPFSSLMGTPQSSVRVALTSSDEDIVSLGIAVLEQENAA